MRAGDVIVNVPDKLLVTVVDERFMSSKGMTYTFKIDTTDKARKRIGWHTFSGTTEELFSHVAGQIQVHNRHVDMFGGKVF
ncbi:hypothetical protein P59_224 [Bacillus phage P59]|nr:hypothetical protein P59_224 [Bacillus phage P59]